MKKLEIDLETLAKSYGLDVLLAVYVRVQDDGRRVLALEGEVKT